MTTTSLYPASPAQTPKDLTQAKASYKRQAWLAMLGLVGFMVIYIALLSVFAFITVKSVMSLMGPGSDNSFLLHLLLAICSGLLTVFMLKSLFAVRKMGDPDGIEITQNEQPELFNFLHTLSDEVGAPKPHRVFLTPQVNAAVFYDLSLINLLIPSKKNLIIGLGLVNVLNLTEFKAVLAHEFGHFSQNSMLVGRWVYIAQQIIAHMVSVRDWLDSVVRYISSIDVRIAWIGWVLSLILWSLRSMMDTLFKIVIIAERALSREMEFNADLVAVSVTGSDALVNALYKLQTADQAWNTALNVAGQVTNSKHVIDDLFAAQSAALAELRRVLDDKNYGQPPMPTGAKQAHRVFETETARPPQMWSTHPPNSDREVNAKLNYIEAADDERSAWLLFKNADKIRREISLDFYNRETTKDFEVASPKDAMAKNFSNMSYSPEYRGAYLGRSPVRDFKSVAQIFELANVKEHTINLEDLYPDTIRADLKAVRNLESEAATLEALLSGELKPSGGVIRHRGKDLTKQEIPEFIKAVQDEKADALHKLMQHEANCRATYMNIAKSQQKGWPEYLKNTLELLHCSDHLLAIVRNEQALMINTWRVITADGKIGYFEKKRMLKVCKTVDESMRVVSEKLGEMKFSDKINKELGIESWSEASPVFDFSPANKKNWPQWVQEAAKVMDNFEHALSVLHNIFLEDLLESEAMLKSNYIDNTPLKTAPASGHCPQDYPTLLAGEEYVLQQKLDLWNRFQLAHGFVPSMLRTVVALAIVGGTIYTGLSIFKAS